MFYWFVFFFIDLIFYFIYLLLLFIGPICCFNFLFALIICFIFLLLFFICFHFLLVIIGYYFFYYYFFLLLFLICLIFYIFDLFFISLLFICFYLLWFENFSHSSTSISLHLWNCTICQMKYSHSWCREFIEWYPHKSIDLLLTNVSDLIRVWLIYEAIHELSYLRSHLTVSENYRAYICIWKINFPIRYSGIDAILQWLMR